MTSQTQNCVECAFRMKRRRAVIWSGAVLLITDDEKRKITAGWCRYHKNIDMPPKKHLSGCIALWQPDMGLE